MQVARVAGSSAPPGGGRRKKGPPSSLPKAPPPKRRWRWWRRLWEFVQGWWLFVARMLGLGRQPPPDLAGPSSDTLHKILCLGNI